MTKAAQHKQTVLLSIDDGVNGHIAEDLNLCLASLLCPEHVLVNLRGGSFFVWLCFCLSHCLGLESGSNFDSKFDDDLLWCLILVMRW